MIGGASEVAEIRRAHAEKGVYVIGFLQSCARHRTYPQSLPDIPAKT
jgi:hypothetical protein